MIMVDMYRRGELLAWAKRLVEGLGMEIGGGRGESRKVVESVECGKVRFQWQSQGSPPCQRRFIDSSRVIPSPPHIRLGAAPSQKLSSPALQKL